MNKGLKRIFYPLNLNINTILSFSGFKFKPNQIEQMKELATAAHITKGVIDVFFRKDVILFLFCCFQNGAF